MEIHLKFFGIFREYIASEKNGFSGTLDIPDGSRIEDVLNHFGIPKNTPKMILVNGLMKEDGEILRDGDTLSLFSPLAGG